MIRGAINSPSRHLPCHARTPHLDCLTYVQGRQDRHVVHTTVRIFLRETKTALLYLSVVGTTGLDRLLNTTTVGNLNVPIQEVQEQPNGQFQITENGALNLMKADSMDILVVNNLAQDLSVGREQNVLDKAELTDATLLGDSLSSYQTQEAQQELLSAESSSFIENHSLQSTDSSFLSSLLQTNTDSIGCIDIGNSLMFNTTPEVEVLTSLLEVREHPNSFQAKLDSSLLCLVLMDSLFAIQNFCFILCLHN